jgi:hypothetical protein
VATSHYGHARDRSTSARYLAFTAEIPTTIKAASTERPSTPRRYGFFGRRELLLKVPRINIYTLWSDELKTSSSSHPDLLAQRSIPLSLQEEHG